MTAYDDFSSKSEYGINPKYHFLFNNRFSIINEIEEISHETIARSFISILIDGKAKKRIIEELSMVGINQAFIFPELEYTTRMIKDLLFT